MTKQTPEDAFAISIADEIRAELARQRKTAADLAIVLGITQHTMGRRLNGHTPFNMIEMSRIAEFLGISIKTILDRAERPVAAVAS
ncbi:helix-turn-helix domain-containing protein [Microbacterium sp. NPDC056052]|uniref:helix-turn-helix domain-containing protein n=1 Tax=Microbacterium sp. NPDC056052 TaxID=3345695 RepID=UPI0035E06D78